jgi:hypothetical protein
VRLLVCVVVALLVAPLATTAAGEPRATDAKKCFKKKRGKRVRVKCPKPKPKTTQPPPAPAAPTPMTDPVAISALTSLVSGQLLHQFATSRVPSDEKLYLCGDGTYMYVATLDPATTGLAGVGKTSEHGTWRITGAGSAGEARFDGGLLLLPADGSPPHLARLSAQQGSEGVIAFVNDAQWYASPATLCGTLVA